MDRRRTLLMLLALAALTARTWFYPYFARFDSGAYLMGIESVAHGQAPRILSHPQQPPATYPPVTMILLAPVYALTGGSDVALRIALSLLWLAAMWIFYVSQRSELDERRGRAVLALAATGSVWLYCGRIQSEIPYLLLTVAGLAVLGRWKRDERFFGGGWALSALALSALIPLTRQIGLTFVLGAAIYLAWDRRRLKRGLVLAALVLVVGAWPGMALYSVTQPRQFSPTDSSVLRRSGWEPERGHIPLLGREMLGRVKMNIVASGELAPAALFPRDFAPTSLPARIGMWVLAALMAIGFVVRCRRGPTVVEFYLLAYLALLLVIPWLVETRFYTVLVPWLAVYLLEGGEQVARLAARRPDFARGAALMLVFILVLVNVTLIAQYRFTDRWSQRGNEQARLFRWGADRLQPGQIVLTADPFAFFVAHRFQGLSYAVGEQKYQPQFRLEAYVAGGGRLDAILFPSSDREVVQRALAHLGLTMGKETLSAEGWVLAPLQRGSARNALGLSP